MTETTTAPPDARPPVPPYMVAAEERAHAMRLTITEVLGLAKVNPSTWTRGKQRGFLRAKTIKRIEDALDWYAAQQRKDATDGK